MKEMRIKTNTRSKPIQGPTGICIIYKEILQIEKKYFS
jgi:hypothetical protein